MAEDRAVDSLVEQRSYPAVEGAHQPQPWQYEVAMPQPEMHFFHIQLTISNWHDRYLDLHLPVWTPGSYLVREYAKHLQDFTAGDRQGNPLKWQKVSKNHWRIETVGIEVIQVNYKLFANELTVRTNHLDGTHGYFNGASTFMFVPGCEDRPLTVKIVLPKQEWAIATALPPVKDNSHTFYADNFDTLVDSPFEIGLHSRHEFTVLGKPHEFIIWGEGNPNPDQIIQDTAAIIRVEADLFGGLPYDRYMFLLHLSSTGNGGLEHKNCCSLNYPRLGFRKDGYVRFLTLVAHEFFHTWNVKRIRPKALEKFDYDRENYTPSLWFCEGTTSYYDRLIPLRAGLYDVDRFLKMTGDSITRLQTTPGRNVQTLHESSLDAWIKLYRPEVHSQNTQISYYLKGELVSMLLDLSIRSGTDNRRSLDDVMRVMWDRFGKSEIGFSESELYEAIESVAGIDLQPFWQAYLYSTTELDYNDYLEPFGLEVQAGASEAPYTGITVKSNSSIPSVKFVEADSPAQRAGIDPGDELLAINGIRVTTENWGERLQDFQPGDAIAITLFQQDRLCNVHLVLQPPVSDRYTVTRIPNPSTAQQNNLRAWLGE